MTAITGDTPPETLFQSANEVWRQLATPETSAPVTTSKQKARTFPIAEASQRILLSGASDYDRARLFGCADCGSGDWINVLPSNTLGLCLTADQFRMASDLRLGAHVNVAQPCLCVTNVDPSGNHSLICP